MTRVPTKVRLVETVHGTINKRGGFEERSRSFGTEVVEEEMFCSRHASRAEGSKPEVVDEPVKQVRHVMR